MVLLDHFANKSNTFLSLSPSLALPFPTWVSTSSNHGIQDCAINGTLQIHLTIKTIRSLLSAAHYLPLPPPPTSASRRARCRILLRSAGALVGIIEKGVSHHQTNIHPTSNVLRSPKTNITIKDLVSFFAPKLFRQCKQC